MSNQVRRMRYIAFEVTSGISRPLRKNTKISLDLQKVKMAKRTITTDGMWPTMLDAVSAYEC